MSASAPTAAPLPSSGREQGVHKHGPTVSCDEPDVEAVAPVQQRSESSQRRINVMHKYGLNHAIAGSTAGLFSKTLMQPIDLIKTRMQVQDGRGKNEYKGIVDAFRSVVRNEGVINGLYRGLSANLIGSGVSWGCYFFAYNHFKEMYRRQFHYASKDKLPPYAHLACAAATGGVTSFVTNPIWLIKVRLQLQGKEVTDSTRVYRGVTDALVRIVRDEGVLALWRGLGPALVLTINPALQFTFYEQLKRFTAQYVGGESNLKSYHFLVMGGAAKGELRVNHVARPMQ